MSFRTMRKYSGLSAVSVGLVLSVSACSDSTGPGNLSPHDALSSLFAGSGALADVGTPALVSFGPSLGTSASLFESLVGKVNVTIGGSQQTMFALGIRETFPAGTCEETLFLTPFPPDPTCTDPSIPALLILWQSHSADAPPDRMIIIGAQDGANDFSLFDVTDAMPAFAIYLQGFNAETAMFSVGGILTNHVSAAAQSCSLPLPPYAKTGTCSIANFDEQGTISFSPITDTPAGDVVVTIPSQTIHGLWESITATQPIELLAGYPRPLRMLRK
jgi:hypothetical protein